MVDPVSFLLTNLAQAHAPFGEESRLRVTTELFGFSRRQGEQIDALISRFMVLRFRAREHGGQGMTWEGYAWLLLKACGLTSE